MDGHEVYLDILITRDQFDKLIESRVQDSVRSAREAITDAGYAAHDIERIVFVGGPTQYKPLQDTVSFELGINTTASVNPMTAVATGAAIFAESIDWTSISRGRKKTRDSIRSTASVSFNFTSRTPGDKAKVVAVVHGTALSGMEVQFDSRQTGWTSGRVALKDGASLDLPLPRMGEHTFNVSVHGSHNEAIKLSSETIVITRTAATVDSIPASHSIFVEARLKAGGVPRPVYLVRRGDALPKQGRERFVAESSVLAGSDDELRVKLWEGEIESPVTDNGYIGKFAITGDFLTEGLIRAGDDLILEYEVLDSGNIRLEVAVPSVGASFNGPDNLYSRREAQINFEDPDAQQQVLVERRNLENRIAALENQISDHRLDQARAKVERTRN